MTEQSSNHEPIYPAELVDELDELTYKRFRSETNQSQSLSLEEAERIRELISVLWTFPKPSPGMIVAGAELESVAGKGAFGTVWKARELETGEERAVKVFDADRLGDGLAVHLFRRGVRAMLYLRSQSESEQRGATTQELSRFIVRICNVEPHMLAFSMDWIPDKDLSHGAIRGRSIEDKVRIFRHIANAVNYAHTRPEVIVHRDLKPQNIVMMGDTPILTDFDIADMTFAKTLSRRAVGGAFSYAAPEQLSGECEHLEPRSDIYSLGRLLHFFLLEKDPPLLIENSPPLEDLNAYPEGLVKIIRRCTSRDLPMRYSNVAELLKDLGNYLVSKDVGAFGPNVDIAQRHWKEADSLARQGLWDYALQEGEQALEYIRNVDHEQLQSWSYQMLKWKVRSGRLRLLPDLLVLWFRNLTLPVSLLFLLLFLSPLLIPIRHYVSSQVRQDRLEQVLSDLLKATSLKTKKFERQIVFLKEDTQRLQKARDRFLMMLSRSKGKEACRLLVLLYHVAPVVHIPEYRKKETRFHDLPHVLKPMRKQRVWGPIQCPQVSLPGLLLSGGTFQKKFTVWEINANRSNFWGLFAPGTAIKGSFANSNLFAANLERANLMRSDFSGANLFGSNLKRAAFHFVRALGTDFRYADMRNIDFTNADLRFSDLREAQLKGSLFLHLYATGAIFSSRHVDVLRKGKMFAKPQHRAVCLSGGDFFMGGKAEKCFRWHRQTELRQFREKVESRPFHCPLSLRKHEFFISFLPGELKQEGVCPWARSKPKSRP